MRQKCRICDRDGLENTFYRVIRCTVGMPESGMEFAIRRATKNNSDPMEMNYAAYWISYSFVCPFL